MYLSWQSYSSKSICFSSSIDTDVHYPHFIGYRPAASSSTSQVVYELPIQAVVPNTMATDLPEPPPLVILQETLGLPWPSIPPAPITHSKYHKSHLHHLNPIFPCLSLSTNTQCTHPTPPHHILGDFTLLLEMSTLAWSWYGLWCWG